METVTISKKEYERLKEKEIAIDSLLQALTDEELYIEENIFILTSENKLNRDTAKMIDRFTHYNTCINQVANRFKRIYKGE